MSEELIRRPNQYEEDQPAVEVPDDKVEVLPPQTMAESMGEYVPTNFVVPQGVPIGERIPRSQVDALREFDQMMYNLQTICMVMGRPWRPPDGGTVIMPKELPAPGKLLP